MSNVLFSSISVRGSLTNKNIELLPFELCGNRHLLSLTVTFSGDNTRKRLATMTDASKTHWQHVPLSSICIAILFLALDTLNSEIQHGVKSTNEPLTTKKYIHIYTKTKMQSLPHPKELNFKTLENLAQTWLKWREQFTLFLIAIGAAKKKKSENLHLTNMHRREREIYSTFEFENEQLKYNLETIIEKFNNYCQPMKNLIFLIHNFLLASKKNIKNLMTMLRSYEIKRTSVSSEKYLTEFHYNTDVNSTFLTWFVNFKDIFNVDFREQTDDWEVRLLLRKICPSEHDKYFNYILLRHPQDCSFVETVEILKQIFSEYTPLFNATFNCLNITKCDSRFHNICRHH